MSDTTITVKNNGPFLVQGNVSIIDAEGKEFNAEGKAIPLCRCGASTAQPFCNGTHRKIEFESVVRASDE
ncbi:MAG: CDGSH iron-sulfur domain-containing protein [Cyanobacteria bacterium P01_C01_bin.72]